jgi:hypothetical protein
VHALEQNLRLKRTQLTGFTTTVQPAASAEAVLRQMSNAFEFQAVINPATPTGIRETDVLFHVRTRGSSWSAFSAWKNESAAI